MLITRKDYVMLAHELSGVIADVEHGLGFDEICLDTIKRVQTQLFNWGEEASEEQE